MQPFGIVNKKLVTAVIPTKNRSEDLQAAVESIVDQSRIPDQLVIVDQSNDTMSRDVVLESTKKTPGMKLTYIHDPRIPGLVAAKAESLKYADGDIICFLEDDVVLERDYIESIINGFFEKQDMLGCSGIVTNPPKVDNIYLLFHKIFHRGIFEDRRPMIYAKTNSESEMLIESNALSGGLSAWRKEVFDHVRFDTRNGFHMIEDFEFSRRAIDFFGNHFFINTKARLAHNFSPANRDVLDKKHQRKTVEYIIFYKKNRFSKYALINMIWLYIGLCIDAVAQSLSNKTTLPLRGIMKGAVYGPQKKLIS